jgi:hypothetical protein
MQGEKMKATMSRLEQAIAIRDALLKRCPEWYRRDADNVRRVTVPVPGFECKLLRHSDGVHCSLEIWPDTGEHIGQDKLLGDKLLNLWWDDHGRGELVSLRAPKQWMDQLLTHLDPDGGGKRVARRRFKVVQ